MFRKISAVIACVMLLSCWGCVILPSGEPPRGDLVSNPQPVELSLDELVLSLGGRIAASSMEFFPGGPVAIEADRASLPVVRAAFREAGRICGVHAEQVAAAVLNGRKVGENVYEFELFYFSRSLWRCTYILRKVQNP